MLFRMSYGEAVRRGSKAAVTVLSFIVSAGF
jgi:hypothetical protein